MEYLLSEERQRDVKNPRLDPSHRVFDPKFFIKTSLANVSYQSLEDQLVDQVGDAEAKTREALKDLIRDNLRTFIDSKDAMDYVYNTDNSLFSGEALSGIMDAFEDARAGCDELVAPTQELHEEMIRNRKSQDMLEKLYTVLRVPGVLYECCGVRVALKKSTVDASQLRDDEDDDKEGEDETEAHADAGAGGSKREKTSQRCDDDDDEYEGEQKEEEEEDEDEEEDDEEDERGGGSRGRRVPPQREGAAGEIHGALERSHPGARGGVAAGAQKNEFLIGPDEEVFYWYGTPLVRLGDASAQRARVEESGNLEGAVLHVRRAMLYLEETYDLEQGTLKGDGEQKGVGVDDRARQGSDSDLAETESQQRAAHANNNNNSSNKSAFIFRFSIALLRAALYLLEQLADELVRCSASDTVLIEDTLSMMMDVSIATVKLFCFCHAMLPGLGQRNAEALAKLRSQLVVQSSTGAPQGTDGTDLVRSPRTAAAMSSPAGLSFTSSSPSFALTGGTGNEGGSSAAKPVANVGPSSAGARRVQRHPVQFFIKVTSHEHNRLTLSSAVDLLQEAKEWGRKATARTHLQTEAAIAAHKAAAATVAGEGGYDKFDSGSLAGGLFGAAINDSFSGSFLFTNAAQSAAAGGGPSGKDNSTSASGDSTRRGSSSVEATGFNAPLDGSLRLDSGAPRAGAAAAETQEARTAAGLSRSAEMDVLRAFRTPEAHFDSYTTIRIGEYDMTSVLEYSCAQVYLHSKSMLGQLLDRSDTEVNIMAQGSLLNSFAARLLQSSVDNLEHVLVSYWSGIATTIHAGVFDFKPEVGSSFARMLDLVTKSGASSGLGGAAAGATGVESAANTRASPPPSTMGAGDGAGASTTSTGAAPAESDESASAHAAGVRGGGGGSAAMEVPPLRYLPVLCEAALPTELREAARVGRDAKVNSGKSRSGQNNDSISPNLSFAIADVTAMTLRDLSMYTVRNMIRSASSIVSSVFLAFVNRSVFAAFVRSMAQYTDKDVRESRADEAVELHAATLVEVLLGQWGRMMTGISDAVLRVKVAVGESCTQATVSSDVQLTEVADLLEELEQLRSTCLRCYLHGVGMLSKAYVTMLPLLSSASATEEDGESGLEHRVRARLSRDFVSTRLSNKVLNTLALVVDRVAPFLRRHSEVFDSADLFAAKAEDAEVLKPAPAAGDTAHTASRRRVLRRRRQQQRDGAASGRASRSHSVANSSDAEGGDGGGDGGVSAATGFSARVDPVTQMIAEHHSRLVQSHLSEHEALIQALVSNVLLVFVDTLHRRSHSLCSSPLLGDSDKEQGIVESIADTLALPTTAAPIFVEHILQPAVFEQLVLLTPEAVSVQDRRQLLTNKVQQFHQVYLAVVSEHCQLAVDAMVGMYLSIPQQFITNELRRSGFVVPLFDWQRASAQTCDSVRSYISNCIVRIAEAGETLHWIRQPALGAAVTQRLVAHLAVAFVTALNVDITPFEMSGECSPDFLTHGTLLLEAEALTILEVVRAVLSVGGVGTAVAQDVQPELLLAEELLRHTSTAMIQYGDHACQVLEAANAAAVAAGGGVSGDGYGSVDTLLTISERAARRSELVEAAGRATRFMVAAIRTHMDEASLATSATSHRATGQGQKLIERLAKRTEGYDAAAAGRPTRRKKAVKKARKSSVPPSPAPEEEAQATTSPRVRKITRVAGTRVGADAGTETPPLSPTTSPAGVTFNLGNEDEANAAVTALITAGSASILKPTRVSAGGAGGRPPRRISRRRAATDAAEAERTSAEPEALDEHPAGDGGRGELSSVSGSRRNSRLLRGSAAVASGEGASGRDRPRRRLGADTTGDGEEERAAGAAARRARLGRSLMSGAAAARRGADSAGEAPAGAGGGLEARAAARRERRSHRFGREKAV